MHRTRCLGTEENILPSLRNKRKGERAYDMKPTGIMLKGRVFQVNDIGSEGIGIVLEEDGPRFFIGERLEKIPIPLQSGMVNVKGIVSHISINTTCTVCGIRFLFSDDEFNAIIQFKKERTYPSQ